MAHAMPHRRRLWLLEREMETMRARHDDELRVTMAHTEKNHAAAARVAQLRFEEQQAELQRQIDALKIDRDAALNQSMVHQSTTQSHTYIYIYIYKYATSL